MAGKGCFIFPGGRGLFHWDKATLTLYQLYVKSGAEFTWRPVSTLFLKVCIRN